MGFDDLTLIACVKKMDEQWIEYENGRKHSNEQSEQQKLEQEAIEFTMDEKQNDDVDDEEEEDDDIYNDDNEESDVPSMNAMGLNEHGCVGSTVVFCIVLYNENNDNYELTTVNLGDSRSILLKKEEENEEYKLIELSADHKPDTLEEK